MVGFGRFGGGGTSGTGAGVTDHNLLNNLTYAAAGHVGFQPALGFTAENVANKSTNDSLGGATPSDTKYASQKAVKTYVDAHATVYNHASLTNLTYATAAHTGFEDVLNKSTNDSLGGAGSSNTLYPSQLAAKTYIDAHATMYNHSALLQKDYASAGHTGFASTGLVAHACQTPYRGSTICVAASDSTPYSKRCADFVCPAIDALDYITTTVLPTLPTTGGKIILLEGTYTMNSDNKGIHVTIPGVTIEGMGDSTLIQASAAATDGYLIGIDEACNYFTLKNVQLFGYRTSTTNWGLYTIPVGFAGPYLMDIEGVHFHDCKIGFEMSGRGSHKITNCFFDDCGYSYYSHYHVGTITGCIFIGGNSSGIFLGGQGNTVVTGCYFNTYEIGQVGGARLSSCILGTTGGITEYGLYANADNTITGCKIFSARDSLTLNYGNTISGCVFTGSAGSRTPGTFQYIDVAGYNNKVDGNSFNPDASTENQKAFVSFRAGTYDNTFVMNVLYSKPMTACVLNSGSNNLYGYNSSDVLTIATASDADYYVHDAPIDGGTPYTCTLVTKYPDVPRNVEMTLDDATHYVTAFRATVNGIDALGENKTEQFHFANFSSLKATGNRAFMKINSIVIQNVAPWMPDTQVLNVGLTATGGRLKLGLSGRATAYVPDIIYTRKNGTDYVAPPFNSTYMTLAPSTPIATDQYEVQFRKNANYWTV